jgi:tetratricopeptide (TPR) repeat protein
LALALSKQRKFDLACHLLVNLLKSDPKNSEMRSQLGEIYDSWGFSMVIEEKSVEAVPLFKRALQFSDDEFICLHLLWAFNLTDRLESADSLIKNKIKTRVLSNKTVSYQYASMLRSIFDNGNAKDPNRYLRKVVDNLNAHIDQNPNDAGAYWLLGNTFLFLNDYGRAVKNLKEGHEKDPTDFSLKLDLGEALLVNGNFQDIPTLFEKIEPNKLDQSDFTLALFMRYVANLAMSDKGQQVVSISDLKNELDTLLTRNGLVITNWSYDPFERWLLSYTGSSKTEIRRVLNQMQARTDFRANSK